MDEDNDTIYVYRAEIPLTPTRYRPGDVINCQPLLPNWQRRVADIFAEDLSAEVVAGEVAEAWRAEGREEGITMGELNRTQVIARAMVAEGMDAGLIVRLTDLSVEQIQAMQPE